MYKKVILAIIISCLLFTGCGRTTSEIVPINDNTISGPIDYETSRKGLDSSLEDFEANLENNRFYVVHDGIYYSLFNYDGNEAFDNFIDDNATDSYIDCDTQSYYTIENFIDVPTLFPGDHLIYYSTDTFQDVIYWNRFEYLGPTFGINTLKQAASGRYYLDFSDDDYFPTVEGSELTQLDALDIESPMLDKIGGLVIDDSLVKNGLIMGAARNTPYDLEVYTGTQYKHFNAYANIEALQLFEGYASSEFETLQTYFWDITIPEYFVTGYYDVNGQGILRYIKESYYSIDDTDFNEPLLITNSNYSPGRYSENPHLNEYRGEDAEPGTLGYVDPDAEIEIAEEETDSKTDIEFISQLKPANIITNELWFPKNKKCVIDIVSPSKESTGAGKITFENGTSVNLTYNRFENTYSAIITGNDSKGTLTTSGFWDAYNINLTNAELYEGQDLITEVDLNSDSSSSSESSEDDSSKNSLLKALD